MPQAKMLITASISQDNEKIAKAISKLEYRIKNNYKAYLSHRKKVLISNGQLSCAL